MWLKKKPAPAAAAPADTLDWRTFTERYAQACQAQTERAVRVRWADNSQQTLVCFTLEDGTEAGLSPQAAFLSYQQDPARLDALLADIPAQVQHLCAPQAPCAGCIFPIVRNLHALRPAELADAQEASADSAAPLDDIVLPLAGDLALSFVLDHPESMTTLRPPVCAEMGIADEAALYALALENFSAYAGSPERTRLHRYDDAPGLYYFELDQVYESSLILFLGDILDAYQPALQGPPVFAVPARHVLLLCGAQDAHALQTLQKHVRTVCEQCAYLVSAQLYTLDENGAIAPFAPTATANQA